MFFGKIKAEWIKLTKNSVSYLILRKIDEKMTKIN